MRSIGLPREWREHSRKGKKQMQSSRKTLKSARERSGAVQLEHCAWQGGQGASFEREAGFDQAGLAGHSQSLDAILSATGALTGF